MKIIFVRHCETDLNKLGILQGCLNVPLNDYGKLQALEIPKKLEKFKFRILISSKLFRTSQTAEPIAKARNIDIIFDDRCSERDYGIYQGITYKEYGKIKRVKKLKSLRINQYIPNGETALCFQNRVVDLLKEIEKKYVKEKNVVIVTHGGVISEAKRYYNCRNAKRTKNGDIFIIDTTKNIHKNNIIGATRDRPHGRMHVDRVGGKAYNPSKNNYLR
jgi:probable phosphoglycerate mutase